MLDFYIDRVTSQTRRNKCDYCGKDIQHGRKRFIIDYGERARDRRMHVFCTKTHLMDYISKQVNGAIRFCRVFEFHAKHPIKEVFQDG